MSPFMLFAIGVSLTLGGALVGALITRFHLKTKRDEEVEGLRREAVELRQTFERQRRELAQSLDEQLGKMRGGILTAVEAYQSATTAVREKFALHGELIASTPIAAQERAALGYNPEESPPAHTESSAAVDTVVVAMAVNDEPVEVAKTFTKKVGDDLTTAVEKESAPEEDLELAPELATGTADSPTSGSRH